jgi:hypothetical protein
MKRISPQQNWKEGDCFVLPLNDGSGILGQVIAYEPLVLNSASCAFFDQRLRSPECPLPELSRLFSTVLTTRDLLDSGRWKVVASHPVQVPREKFPFEPLRHDRFIGAKVIGSRNVEEFMNAFCGLTFWDDWADPNYLDRLLISPTVKPKNLLYKAR